MSPRSAAAPAAARPMAAPMSTLRTVGKGSTPTALGSRLLALGFRPSHGRSDRLEQPVCDLVGPGRRDVEDDRLGRSPSGLDRIDDRLAHDEEQARLRTSPRARRARPPIRRPTARTGRLRRRPPRRPRARPRPAPCDRAPAPSGENAKRLHRACGPATCSSSRASGSRSPVARLTMSNPVRRPSASCPGARMPATRAPRARRRSMTDVTRVVFPDPVAPVTMTDWRAVRPPPLETTR